MPKVHYNSKTVSDPEIRRVLQTIADLYAKDVKVTSGNRDFVPTGGSKTSLHLDHKAADFHVMGVTDAKVFQDLKIYISMVFNATDSYEVVWHGSYTGTSGPHMHLGHYSRKKGVGYVKFKTEGLTQKTKNHYTKDKRAIPRAVPH